MYRQNSEKALFGGGAIAPPPPPSGYANDYNGLLCFRLSNKILDLEYSAYMPFCYGARPIFTIIVFQKLSGLQDDIIETDVFLIISTS